MQTDQVRLFSEKRGKQSGYHCAGVKILDGAIKIPKISPVEAKIHSEIKGELKSITLSRSATGKYHATLLCDDGIKAATKPALISNVTGLDMGLTHFAIKSDGSPCHLIKASHNLRRKQKAFPVRKRAAQTAGKHEYSLLAYMSGQPVPVLLVVKQTHTGESTDGYCNKNVVTLTYENKI